MNQLTIEVLVDLARNLTLTLNKFVSSTKTLADNSSTPLERVAAKAAIASALANFITAVSTPFKIYPGLNLFIKVTSGWLNVVNFDLQTKLLNEAIASGDNSKIIQASLGLASSVAGVLGSVPSPIQGEAKAINILLTAAGALYSNGTNISQALGVATTQISNIPSNPLSAAITGTGRDMPSQLPNSTIQYTELINGNGITLIYTDGVIYTDNGTIQQWSVPDSNGGATTYTRNVVGGFAYGDWQIEQIPLIGTISTSTVTGTIPSELITLTSASANPFITGAGITSTLSNSTNLTLAQQIALAVATGTPITFADQSVIDATGSSYTCNLDLSAASGSDQTITLSLSGGANNMVFDGNTKQYIKFVNGTATIIVPAGKSSLELTIIDGNNVNIADELTLSATITGADGTPSTSLNNLAITFTDPNPGLGVAPGPTLVGGTGVNGYIMP